MTQLDQRSATQLTNGFLPTAAFAHLEPTEIGVVDLDRPLRVALPIGRDDRRPARDSLLLIRLHGQPLRIVYAPTATGGITDAELAELLWREAGAEILDHVTRCGCCKLPRDAAALLGGLGPTSSCGSFKGDSPSVSVVIPTGGRPDRLLRCLGSLSKLENDFEILVVHNRPEEEGTRELISSLSAEDERVRYVAESRPGSMVARNRGIAEARGEIVAFIDDDMVVDGGWLHGLIAPFGDREVGAVTGMVLPMELETPAQKRFEQYAGFSKGLERCLYDLTRHRADDRLLYPFWGGVFGSGGSMAFRRDRMVASGGFDPALGNGTPALAGGDIDALSAVVLRGERLVYEPRSLSWHEHLRDEEALRRRVFNYSVGFTAILTKALITDRRFLPAAIRSVPIAIERRRSNSNSNVAPGAAMPRELVHLERKGMLQGPRRYFKSRAWARKLDLDRVILGS